MKPEFAHKLAIASFILRCFSVQQTHARVKVIDGARADL